MDRADISNIRKKNTPVRLLSSVGRRKKRGKSKRGTEGTLSQTGREEIVSA